MHHPKITTTQEVQWPKEYKNQEIQACNALSYPCNIFDSVDHSLRYERLETAALHARRPNRTDELVVVVARRFPHRPSSQTLLLDELSLGGCVRESVHPTLLGALPSLTE